MIDRNKAKIRDIQLNLGNEDMSKVMECNLLLKKIGKYKGSEYDKTLPDHTKSKKSAIKAFPNAFNCIKKSNQK